MITVTALPELGAVRLVGDGVGEDVVEVWRTDNNGTRLVRTLAGALPSASFVLEDYEAAVSGPLSYTFQHASGWKLAATTALDVPATWLSLPVAPANAVELDMVRTYQDERAGMGTVHEVIGRRDPLAALGALRARAGRLELWCRDWPAAAAVVRLLDRPGVFLLRQPDYAGLDLWFVVTRISRQPHQETTEPRRWALEVEYRETNPQTGPLVGTLGRTWADVLAEYPTWLELQANNDTWADVITGG